VKVAIGCDNLAYEAKEDLKKYLTGFGHEVVDFGCHSAEPIDYPDVASVLAEAVAAGEAERGILLCGTGIGMAIAANKVKGIRAAGVYDEYSAERAALSNDAHIITMGVKTMGQENIRRMSKLWLDLTFQGGPSAEKIAKIMQIEERHMGKQ